MCEQSKLIESVKVEQNRKVLSWRFKNFGLFEATIWDNKLTDFRAYESGSVTNIHTSNLEFLKAVKVMIDDVIKEIEQPKMQYKQLSFDFENEN